MNYGAIKQHDVANGEGVRVSLFVSGCRRHCKGCFNEDTWDFGYGLPFTSHTFFELLKYLDKPYIRGLTILGGEPMDPENVEMVASIVSMFRTAFGESKDIWLYTGYKFEEIMGNEILSQIDVLVDGPYVEELADISLRFRGSKNQRILDARMSHSAGRAVLIEELN